MSNILLIEPDRMLQHAFTVALFPEHRVKVVHSIPELAPKDADLLIVDAIALQTQESFSAQDLRVLAAWKLPMIWVADDQAVPARDRDKIVRIEKPLLREALQRALAECLGKTSAPKRDGYLAEPPIETPAFTKPKAKRKASAAPSERGQFIELVDVVEEASASENAAEE